MITDVEIAQAVYDTYAYNGPVSWDHLITDGAVYIGVRRFGAEAVAACRGSSTFEDWVHDFIAVGKTPATHPKWGPIHPGFDVGIDVAWTALYATLKTWGVKTWYVGGHSLGAGHCDLLTASAVEAGWAPQRYIRFGEPRPGFKQFAAVLSDVAGTSYEACDNKGHDLVCDVPFTFGPEDYVHPQPTTPLIVHPDPSDAWGVFKYHHMVGYLTALGGVAK